MASCRRPAAVRRVASIMSARRSCIRFWESVMGIRFRVRREPIHARSGTRGETLVIRTRLIPSGWRRSASLRRRAGFLIRLRFAEAKANQRSGRRGPPSRRVAWRLPITSMDPMASRASSGVDVGGDAREPEHPDVEADAAGAGRLKFRPVVAAQPEFDALAGHGLAGDVAVAGDLVAYSGADEVAPVRVDAFGDEEDRYGRDPRSRG